MITVKRAVVEEVQEIRRLLSETWIDTYSSFLPQDVIQRTTALWHNPQTLASEIQDERIFFGVARDEHNRILALVTAGKRTDGVVVIARLYVKPGNQRRGIGSKLLEESINAFRGVKKLRLEVEAQNEKGLSFYRRQGFMEISRKEAKIEDVRHVVVEMEKQLPEQPSS